MKTKTICLFNSNIAWGGGEKWHLSAGQYFKARGHRVIFITNTASQLSKEANKHQFDVFSFKITNLSFFNIVKIFKISRLLKKEKVDIVISNLPIDFKIATLAGHWANIPQIFYRRGMPAPLKNGILNKWLVTRYLNGIIANSQEVFNGLTLNTKHWMPESKLHIIYNGINTNNLNRPLSSRTNENTLIIGCAGRLVEQKGHHHLIELAKILKDKKIKFKIILAGSGPLESELNHKIEKENLNEYIELIGHVTHMSQFFKQIDFFVFPSHYEGSANTLIESMSYGKLSFAFDISSMPEMISHRKTGILIKPFDINDLANEIVFYEKNPDKALKLVQNAYNFVLDTFDYQKNMQKLSTIIFKE